MEINLSKLLSKRVGKMKYKEFSKFPSIKKDVAFIVVKNLESAIIEKQIKKTAGNLLSYIEVFDVYTGEHVEEGKKSIAYSLTFSDSKKTLTDDEVTKLFNKIIADAEIKLGAEIRKWVKINWKTNFIVLIYQYTIKEKRSTNGKEKNR